MQLLQSTEHAIHSLLYLAINQHQRPAILVSELARAQNLSEAYLAKIFQSLAKAGLVRSFRGAEGGYALAYSPEKTTLRQIVQAIEGDVPIFVCDCSKRRCELVDDCYLISVMEKAKEGFCQILEQTTLKDLVDSVQKTGRRVVWLQPAEHSSY